jgi:hypothetical protein
MVPLNLAISGVTAGTAVVAVKAEDEVRYFGCQSQRQNYFY